MKRVTPDLAIVGSGPAGVATAIAARGAGLSVALFEASSRPGGQLHRIYSRVTGVPSFEGDGAALATDLARQLAETEVEPRFGTAVEGLVVGAGAPGLRLAQGELFPARSIVIASGLSPCPLGVKGEREFAGRGVSPSARRDRAKFAGQPVVVAGGGDAAFENALLLAEVGCRVTLVTRGAPRAREEFRRRVAGQPAIEIVTGVRVVEILGSEHVTAVRLAGKRGEFQIEARGVFVKIGSIPNTAWCRDAVACDAEGYVVVDGSGATSAPGVWAAGDVTRPAWFTVAAARAGAAEVVRAVLASD